MEEKKVKIYARFLRRLGQLFNIIRLYTLDHTFAKDRMQMVFKEIEELTAEKTLTIAYRLFTVSNCDVHFLFDNGRLQAQRSYEELLEKPSIFRKITGTMYF